MGNMFSVLMVSIVLRGVIWVLYIYGSYRKIKTGVPLFLEHPVQKYTLSTIALESL